MAQAFMIIVVALKVIEIVALVLIFCKNANKKLVLLVALLVSRSCACNVTRAPFYAKR